MSTSTTLDSPDVSATTGPRDIFGAEIAVGDMIVYATRRGSSTYLNKLKVTAVAGSTLTGFNPDDVHARKRNIQNLGTVAKVY